MQTTPKDSPNQVVGDFEKSNIPRIEKVEDPGTTGEAKVSQEIIPTITQKVSERPRVRSERETEGTKAPKQIEGDPILKSYYKSENGEPLEVDPD